MGCGVVEEEDLLEALRPNKCESPVHLFYFVHHGLGVHRHAFGKQIPALKVLLTVNISPNEAASILRLDIYADRNRSSRRLTELTNNLIYKYIQVCRPGLAVVYTSGIWLTVIVATNTGLVVNWALMNVLCGWPTVKLIMLIREWVLENYHFNIFGATFSAVSIKVVPEGAIGPYTDLERLPEKRFAT
ncbi:unnamed protein product [Heligmosomoides polygyrus]|uniref:Transmembrane protein n=1 Tax=Heligmosomoides polygyrus TaxID=6339 RepID=A0A183GEU7_HELPZ|nr:unnamed protein product [Heligmosomoides polygyrus]